MIVGCKLPHGFTVEHNSRTIRLNGSNVGFNPEAPWVNGAAPDSPDRASGAGLTVVTGEDEAALKDWLAIAGKGDGPVQRGLIFTTKTEADAKQEAKALESVAGTKGLDPAKDLPSGVETDTDKKG